MQTTVTKAGNAPDLLSGILSVQVRNEDKITEQDKVADRRDENSRSCGNTYQVRRLYRTRANHSR